MTSTVVTEFQTDGSSDVVIRFIPLAQTAVHTQIFGINGFQLKQTSSSFTRFRVTSVVHDPETGNVTLTWNSKPDRSYTIRVSQSLDTAPNTWDDIDDGWPSGGEETSFTDTNPGLGRRFYVIEENPRF
ncbi:hypothetical protein N9A94_02165 [Akkermansiaceae bacterium]|nr:hypothetical protein [Akkermansiaceae bacterium]